MSRVQDTNELISFRTRTEEELATALTSSVLESFSRVATVVRSPLSVILGYSENGSASDIKAAMEAIHRSGRRIDQILSDLVSLSELESKILKGELGQTQSSFELRDFLGDLFDSFEETIQELNATVKIDVSETGCRIPGDRQIWYNAFRHLIANALGENGSGLNLSISARCEPTGIVLEVMDDGIGIPPGDLPHVTKPFFRVDRLGKSVRRGVGIGLYYVSRIVEWHRGHLVVSSVPGLRTGVQIVLPLKSS